MALTPRQRNGLWITGVALALVAFLIYFFTTRKHGEKCPDGRDIPPLSGDCSDNAPKKDKAGNELPPEPVKADNSGCIPPSKYITNAFPLTLGMRGELVRGLQMALNVQFASKLKEDGYLGCQTFAAMKKNFDKETMDAQFYNDHIITPNIVLNTGNV